MGKQFTVAILGCGNRGICYTENMLAAPEKYKIASLCDPLGEQIAKMHELFEISGTVDFTDVGEFFREKRADVLAICSPDREHIWQAMRGMELGYDLLLEKPISDDREELLSLIEAQKKTGRKIVVCHELRYGKGYLKCKEILDSGRLGNLYAIDATERVAYWHWPQAYVKGVGASLELGYPAILAKCSHDLDLIQSYAKSECESVSSLGELTFFKKENAPEGSADRCIDCKYINTCPYSAKRVYVDAWHKEGEPSFRWPFFKVSIKVPHTEESLYEGIKTSPQGRCVFKCKTDLVDHQMVEMRFKNGVFASLKMMFAWEMGRRYIFYCDRGELVMDERTKTIEVMPFGEEVEVINTKSLLAKGQRGHGGGDAALIERLYDVLSGESEATTTVSESVESHLIGIAAEKSRKNGGERVFVHK